MAHTVCPWWLGYWLVNPLRRFFEDPRRILEPWVSAGMVVLEPGCGMGYFTLPLARLVGPAGRVVAIDVQERMLAGLRRRASRAGLAERIDARLSGTGGLPVGDLAATADLAIAIHVVHEVPDQPAFFAALRASLKPAAHLVVIEPKGHVTEVELGTSLEAARGAGFRLERQPLAGHPRSALLRA